MCVFLAYHLSLSLPLPQAEETDSTATAALSAVRTRIIALQRGIDQTEVCVGVYAINFPYVHRESYVLSYAG